jgi:RNA polymerase sigma-70 factor (ECF subfamily)
VLAQERGQRKVEAEVADLVAAHRRDLLDLCQRRLGGDRHLAEDVVQETFLKLGRALASGQEIQNPRGWLRTVASHGTVDELRRRGPMLLVEPPDTIGAEDVELGGASAELEAAWRGLTPRHREVLRLRELEGLHYEEIATAMATGVSAVETLLFRARTALRREYSRAAANIATAQAQLAAAPLASGGDGWFGRLAERLGAPAAGAGRFEQLLDALRARLAELTATVAIGSAALGGALAPAPEATPVAPLDIAVPAVPSPVEVPELPATPSVPDVSAVDADGSVPDVPVDPVDAPDGASAPTAPVAPADVVAAVVDAVAGDGGLLREILDPTARFTEGASSNP